MTRLPQIALLPDGKRLHLQDGPIDLIIEAKGNEADVRAAYEAAARRFTGLLDELCEELGELRRAADPVRCTLKGVVARRMHAAVAPFATAAFITPMAAVAGSVAEEILGSMLAAARLDRAYVNNGGDIALHLAGREQFTVGLLDRPDRQGLMRTTVIDADDPARGIATSGRHGRSFSLGIADAVTVLAKTASQADAAATIIANAVDLPGHPAIDPLPGERVAARQRPRRAPCYPRCRRTPGEGEIDDALRAGVSRAQQLLAAGLIEGAALRLLGETAVVGATGIKAGALPTFHEGALERTAHV